MKNLEFDYRLIGDDVKFQATRSAFDCVWYESESENEGPKVLVRSLYHLLCIHCILYSLTTLFEERYDVEFLTKNQNETEPTVLACKELSSFNLGKTKFGLEELRGSLIQHFKSPKNYAKWKIFQSEEFKRMILDPIEKKSYVIFNDLLCIILDSAAEHRYDNAFIAMFLSNPVYFLFEKTRLDFVRFTIPTDRFDQLMVLRKGPPYSNCSESNNQSSCLNDCFRSSFRLSRYFYKSNEAGIIHLNSFSNRSEENERSCFRKCNKEDCKIVQYIPISSSDDRNPKTITSKASPNWIDLIFRYSLLDCCVRSLTSHSTSSHTS